MILVLGHGELTGANSFGRQALVAAAPALLALLLGCSGQRANLRPARAPEKAISQTSGWTDLLKTVPDGRAVTGEWVLEDGALKVDDTAAARFVFPYEPPAEYDFLVEFTLSAPAGCAAQLVSKDGTPFAWSMNAGRPPRCRLEDIDGHSVSGNPTLRAYEFQAGKRYVSVVSVRNDRVLCTINGEALVEFRTDYSNLSRNPKWDTPDELCLGVGAWNGPIKFHRIAVREAAR